MVDVIQMYEALQLRLAEITEMIHAASLFHDDVIDEADTRRGVPSVNKVFGNKLAILAGDDPIATLHCPYLISISYSIILSNKLMSRGVDLMFTMVEQEISC